MAVVPASVAACPSGVQHGGAQWSATGTGRAGEGRGAPQGCLGEGLGTGGFEKLGGSKGD
jgi:hypothetical protein